MKQVIITGAGGFIGRALSLHLAQQGVQVYAVQRPKSPAAQLAIQHPNILPVRCALGSLHTLLALLPSAAYDAWYHLAWAGTSGKERTDYRLQLSNVAFACDAIEACAALGCKRFIQAGSIMSYESMHYHLSAHESVPPSYLYGVMKQTAHNLLQAVAKELHISYSQALLSNVYGEGEQSERFINATLRKLLRGERVSFTDGEKPYDFIHISDAVRALSCIGREGRDQQSYYVGNPEPTLLKTYIEQLYAAVHPGQKPVLGEIPSAHPCLTYTEFDTHALSREFGFTPRVPFAEGILALTHALRKT